MSDTIERQDSIVLDIPLLKGELGFISPHSGSLMRRLADSLDRDLVSFFPDTHEETYVYKFVEILRRIEK